MRGKIIYTVVIEKEVEIPDDIVAISEKFPCEQTQEEANKLENFSDSVWDSTEDMIDRLGMYYEENGEWWVIEEY